MDERLGIVGVDCCCCCSSNSFLRCSSSSSEKSSLSSSDTISVVILKIRKRKEYVLVFIKICIIYND
jgi:hypothetical protein